MLKPKCICETKVTEMKWPNNFDACFPVKYIFLKLDGNKNCTEKKEKHNYLTLIKVSIKFLFVAKHR